MVKYRMVNGMKIKTSLAYRTFKIFNCILMAMIVLVTVCPFIYILSLSLSSEKYILAGQITLFPKGLSSYAYRMIFNHPNFLRAYANTIWYTMRIYANTLCFLQNRIIGQRLTRMPKAFGKRKTMTSKML